MALFCNLPSGGLPKGVSALACGTYTAQENITEKVTIQHSLGVKPNFCVIMLEEDTSSTTRSSTLVMGCIFEKTAWSYAGSSYKYSTHIMKEGYNSSANLQNTVTPSDTERLTTTTIFIPADTNFRLPKGCTYKWVCGVIDDII